MNDRSHKIISTTKSWLINEPDTMLILTPVNKAQVTSADIISRYSYSPLVLVLGVFKNRAGFLYLRDERVIACYNLV